MAVNKISKSMAKNLMNTVETFFFDCDGKLDYIYNCGFM